MRGDDDCAARSSDGGASRLDETDCMSSPESCVHKAAWYRDRDNSMSPVSTKKGVGAAMAIIHNKTSGPTQAIQVCPGVYLANAHSSLDDPEEAKKEGRTLMDPNDHMKYINPYPSDDDEYMEIEKAKFTSLLLRDNSNWSKINTDYFFIKVRNPTRKNHFVKPIILPFENEIKYDIIIDLFGIHLYRPKHNVYADSEENLIYKNSKAELDTPLIVNESCKYEIGYQSGLVGSDCPTEAGVSGSPYIIRIDVESFLVGIAVTGSGKMYEKFSRDGNNEVLVSSQFCDDYELVCGMQCVEL